MSSLVCNLTSFSDQRNFAPVKGQESHYRIFGQLILKICNPMIYMKNRLAEFSADLFPVQIL